MSTLSGRSLLDVEMGTLLQDRRQEGGAAGGLWNLDRPPTPSAALDPARDARVFAERLAGLVEGGIDLIATMSDPSEVRAAAQVGADCGCGPAEMKQIMTSPRTPRTPRDRRGPRLRLLRLTPAHRGDARRAGTPV